MKSVLISIKPKYCELIANGSKTIEVRKTRPKIETPFKCYIYCTRQRVPGEILLTHDKHIEGRNKGFREQEDVPLAGKVIGEFVCDGIGTIECSIEEYKYWSKESCLNMDEFINYCNGRILYVWRISGLVIYDKPKDLSEFNKANIICHRGRQKENCVSCWDCQIIRPPQSWCYVELSLIHI